MMYQTFTFRGRHDQHDEAMKIVTDKLFEYGLIARPWGFENEHLDTVKLLRFRTDSTSLAARFKPDQIIIAIGECSALCEVKSESGGRRNFAIEVDSFTGAKLHQSAGFPVIYCYVDLSLDSAQLKCCWLDDAYQPRNIFIPARFDFVETSERLRKLYPFAFFNRANNEKGSGTPYYLLPKDGFRLMDFDEFVTTELMPFLKSPDRQRS